MFVGSINNKTYYSPDGKTWNIVSGEGANIGIYNMVYDNGMFVGNNENKTYYFKPIKRNKSATQVLQAQYPVGSAISLQVKTDPSSYLGFGNWEVNGDKPPYTYTRIM